MKRDWEYIGWGLFFGGACFATVVVIGLMALWTAKPPLLVALVLLAQIVALVLLGGAFCRKVVLELKSAQVQN